MLLSMKETGIDIDVSKALAFVLLACVGWWLFRLLGDVGETDAAEKNPEEPAEVVSVLFHEPPRRWAVHWSGYVSGGD